jgi:hypothetical protein
MNTLDQIFTQYDKLIAPLSTGSQALLSTVLLVFLIWQIYMIIKSGHWIFIAVLIICLPGTWPAARQIGNFVWTAIKFLLVRTGISIS